LSIDNAATPDGSRELAREQIRNLQRRRLLDAMAQVLVEEGLRGATVSRVCARAGISPSSFPSLFSSVEDCLLALFAQVTTRSVDAIVEAFEREPSWEDGVLAGLEALLVFLDSEPTLARVCLVDGPSGPPEALRRRAESLRPLRALVDGGRRSLADEQQPPALTADATIASVAGLLHAALCEGQAPPFIGLLGDLAGVVVAPYLGVAAARSQIERGNARAQILAKETSAPAREQAVAIPKVVRHASAHRRRLCLAYLAENPGVSNQAIAAGIDLHHHGQISTALSRLNEAGLLVLKPGGAGLANAWTLSAYGEQVARALGG
jgi:AcrR family transcriptional regulator